MMSFAPFLHILSTLLVWFGTLLAFFCNCAAVWFLFSGWESYRDGDFHLALIRLILCIALATVFNFKIS